MPCAACSSPFSFAHGIKDGLADPGLQHLKGLDRAAMFLHHLVELFATSSWYYSFHATIISEISKKVNSRSARVFFPTLLHAIPCAIPPLPPGLGAFCRLFSGTVSKSGAVLRRWINCLGVSFKMEHSPLNNREKMAGFCKGLSHIGAKVAALLHVKADRSVFRHRMKSRRA